MGLPLPPFWAPERLEAVWRVPYEQRAAEAEAWALEHGLAPARVDARRIGLLAIDVQNTFCTPGFELFVPGAPDDNRRLCQFLYRNLDSITEIVATMDTHVAEQVFHGAWLVDANGRHPEPYTLVSAEDVRSGVWRAANPAHQEHLFHYVRSLERKGRYRLTVWPYHAMLGGISHALVSAVEEAIFFHGIARQTSPTFELKGDNPLTEHYSALGPEVTEGPAGEEIGRLNVTLLERLVGFDAIVAAGQAKSHCVAWTVEDLLDHAPDVAERLYLLEDCTSPVVVPGTIDYTDEADAAFERFAAAGAHVVRSTDSLDSWPGFGA
jgi:nicotinamidase-related amidase